jgi:hypothetical protein
VFDVTGIMTDRQNIDDAKRALLLMQEALGLLDRAGCTLAGTHLEQALHSVREEVEVL